MKVVKTAENKWIIEGTDSGWIHGKIFDYKYQAQTALSVFKRKKKNSYTDYEFEVKFVPFLNSPDKMGG